jgi:hypothetical protein
MVMYLGWGMWHMGSRTGHKAFFWRMGVIGVCVCIIEGPRRLLRQLYQNRTDWTV